MTNKKRGQINFSDKELTPLVNSAIQEGLKELMDINPKYAAVIQRHVDSKKINHKFKEFLEELDQVKYGDKNKIKKYLREGIAEYIASGHALDKTGQELIFKRGLEEMASSGFFRGSKARRQLKQMSRHEKYLRNIEDAFGDLSTVTETEEGYKKMPELARAVAEVNEKVKIINPAAELLHHYGFFSRGDYNRIQNDIKKTLDNSVYKVKELVAKYSRAKADDYLNAGQNVAASILGICGLGIFVFSQGNITGNLVSETTNLSPSLSGLVGLGCLLVSALVFFKNRK